MWQGGGVFFAAFFRTLTFDIPKKALGWAGVCPPAWERELFLYCSSGTMHTPGVHDRYTPTLWGNTEIHFSLLAGSLFGRTAPPGVLPAERPRNHVPPFLNLKWGDYRGAFRKGGCLFCKKTTSGRIFMSTNGLNNEEALEENMGAGRGCLFLCCSSKQTTSRGLVEAASSRHRPFRAHESPMLLAAIREAPPWGGCIGDMSRRYCPRQGTINRGLVDAARPPISDRLPRVLDGVKWWDHRGLYSFRGISKKNTKIRWACIGRGGYRVAHRPHEGIPVG
jgi:hypothetical protein